MYLSRLFIKNYRSIKELDLVFTKGKNVIIGRNNVGKSNIIKALDLILGENSPNYAKSENISSSDFYSWKENVSGKQVVKSTDEIFIWCELQRDAGEPINYEEIYNCYGFNVHSEITNWIDKKPIKKPIRILKEKLPHNYSIIFGVSEDDKSKEYINPKLRNQKTFEQQFDNKFSFAFSFKAAKDGQENISKELRFLYREGADFDWILAFSAPIRNELLQSAIIPSFRDPVNQLRLTPWTWYGKLMRHLTSGHEKSSELKNALDSLNTIANTIFSQVKEKVSHSSLTVAFPGTELSFQFNADTKTDFYKNCIIYVDDGFKSQITEKGSGIQSATIIGLFNYFTHHVNTVTSALLCVEEPEVYLHPHARRVISDRLDDFLNGNKNQVILTTHSIEFIRTTSDDLNIILVSKTDAPTKATPIKIKEFKHLLIDNNQNELFFADKIIICEGYDDYILRAITKELFPKNLDEQNVSIISVGGKDNISRLAKLVLKLGLKCFVFADFDYLLRDKTESRKLYDASAHENILNLNKNFFMQNCVMGDEWKKNYSAIAKMRNKLKAQNEKAFYTSKNSCDFCSDELNNLLSTLRCNGIGILSGEIEFFSKDKSFINCDSKKLSLDIIYNLNTQLATGKKITDFFDVTEIKEFLKTIFER